MIRRKFLQSMGALGAIEALPRMRYASAAFLPLGLPPDDKFWSSPPAPWTAKKVWNGQDLAADAALKF